MLLDYNPFLIWSILPKLACFFALFSIALFLGRIAITFVVQILGTSVGKILLNGGSLDVEVKQIESKSKKKLFSGGKGDGYRPNQTNMFITVECQKL